MGGKYRAYPEYKDSGVAWLGDVPKDWLSIKFGITNASAVLGGNYACGEAEEGLPVIKMGNLGRGRIKLQKLEYLPKAETYEKSHLLSEGDFLFNTRNSMDLVGKVSVWRGELAKALYNSNILRITFHNKFVGCTEFMNYLFNSDLGLSQLRLNAKGTTSVAAIYYKELKALAFAMPPTHEQIQIANFLDHETAKIDALIEKQQQLIQLLKEKRQAVISHAVTKGLNPDAPMKDSGVEWLGNVPEGWEVRKFGYISSVVRGGSPRPAGDPTLFNGDYSPWVTVAEITKDDEIYLSETEMFLTKKGSDQSRMFLSGTLLLSNSGATLGVPKILKIDANANDGVVGFERLSLNHEFAYFYLSILTENLRERIKQGSGQPNLNTDIVKGIAVPIPSDAEVVAIVASIHETREIFKELTDKAQRGIGLLIERRTALISAAVTGKIDVRNWKAPKQTNNKRESAK